MENIEISNFKLEDGDLIGMKFSTSDKIYYELIGEYYLKDNLPKESIVEIYKKIGNDFILIYKKG